MEKISIPSALSFSYSEIKEFKVYAGSRKGAVQLDTTEFDPIEIWKKHIVQKENYYQKMMMVFINETQLSFSPGNYTFKYKLKNGVLQVYSAQHDEWIDFAYGSKEKMVIKLGLTGIGKELYFDRHRVKNNDETSFGAFNYAGINSLSFLKNKKDMVAWCNIHYTFQ